MPDNPPDRFSEWYEAWPGNGSKGYEDYTRKKNRKGCEEKWKAKNLDDQADVIIRDVEQRKKFDKGWRKQKGSFLVGPLVYLNQEHWKDGEFADLRDIRTKGEVRSSSVKPDDILHYIMRNKTLTTNQRGVIWNWLEIDGVIIGCVVPDDPEEGIPGFRFMASEMMSEGVVNEHSNNS